MHFLNSLLPTLAHAQYISYLVILLLTFFDSLAFIGLLSPGTIVILTVGLLTSKGYFDLGDVIWIATIGAIAGDVTSYYLGSHAKKLFSKENVLLKSSYLEKGKAFFETYGGRSIFLDRFIGPVRPIVTFVAGMSKMNKKTFITWSIISSLGWVLMLLFTGLFFGNMIGAVTIWSKRVGILVFAAVVIAAAVYGAKYSIVTYGDSIYIFLKKRWELYKARMYAIPYIQKIYKKFPKQMLFLEQRFVKNTFFGLPLTLFIVSFLYTFSLFAGTVEDVLNSNGVIMFDTYIVRTMALIRTPEITPLFLWITVLGKSYVVVLFAIATILILVIWSKKTYIIPLLVALIGSETVTFLSKIAIHRPRPGLALYTEHSFSFPSGHATVAVAFYGFLAYIFIRENISWRAKVNIFFTGFFVIILIGFSRLYLGVHYVSDVWGGYLVGLLWFIIGISVSEWLLATRKNPKNTVSIRKKSITIIIIAIVVIGYGSTLFLYHPKIYPKEFQYSSTPV